MQERVLTGFDQRYRGTSPWKDFSGKRPGKGAKFIVRIPLGKELYTADEILEEGENTIVSQLTLDEQKKN